MRGVFECEERVRFRKRGVRTKTRDTEKSPLDWIWMIEEDLRVGDMLIICDLAIGDIVSDTVKFVETEEAWSESSYLARLQSLSCVEIFGNCIR